MITKECYLRKLEITRGFNAPCIVLIIGKVLFNAKKVAYFSKSFVNVDSLNAQGTASVKT